jgi:hypothetical protein
MWDEMYLVKGIKFDTRRRVWDGVANYGSDFAEVPSEAITDHALVLVFRP